MREGPERRSVRVTARSVEKAIEKGLAELGVSREEAQIEIIKEGSRGLLGLGAEDAVVEISVPVKPAPPKPTKAEAPPPAPRKEAAEAPRPHKVEAPRPRREEGAPVPAPAKAAPPPPPSAAPAPKAGKESLAQIAQGVLQELLNRMGLTARVELAEQAPQSEVTSESVVLNVAGKDLGVLIGRRGETLRDLQFITRLIVSRKVQRWPDIVLDVEYYRARREKLLTDLARRMAEKVRLTQQPVTLEPMPPNERRIVHLALRDYPGVYTESTGEGQARKVMILPKPGSAPDQAGSAPA